VLTLDTENKVRVQLVNPADQWRLNIQPTSKIRNTSKVHCSSTAYYCCLHMETHYVWWTLLVSPLIVLILCQNYKQLPET